MGGGPLNQPPRSADDATHFFLDEKLRLCLYDQDKSHRLHIDWVNTYLIANPTIIKITMQMKTETTTKKIDASSVKFSDAAK